MPRKGGLKEEARLEYGQSQAGSPPKEHDWRKQNLVTLEDEDGGMYDQYECDSCGLRGRRYGVSWPPRVEGHRHGTPLPPCRGRRRE